MNRSTTSALLGLAITATPAFAQESATATPQEQPAITQAAVELQQLVQDPQLVTGKLENGLSYMIRPTKEPAGRASIRLYVSTGSLDEQPETSGISHFLEHMVFNGSRSFARGELIPAMQKLGLGFGGDANAYTSLERTVYMLDLPNLKEETVNFALTIMRDFADGAKLEDEAIDHERGIIVSELKSRDSESYRAMLGMIDQICEGSRVAKFMPIGREEVIRNAPYEAFRQYYRDTYIPERMTVIITGDIDPATATEWVKKHFGDMVAKPGPQRPDNGKLTNTGASERLLHNKEQATVSIMATTANPWKLEPDTFEQRVADFPLQLASQMLNMRLSRISQRAEAPFHSANLSDSEMFDITKAFGFSVTAAPEKWQTALTTTEQELRKAIQYGFEPHEFQESLSALASAITHATQTWESVQAADMADRLVNSIAERSILTTPEEDLKVLMAGIELISQNPDCCRAALEAAFDAKRAKLTMSGSIPEGTTEATLRRAFEESAATPVEKPDLRPAKPFAYDHIGEPGSIVKKEYIADQDVTAITLSNGVRVNLKRTDFRKGALTVSAAVDGGTMLLPSTPGLAMVADNVMRLSALAEHDLDELKRVMMGHNVDLNYGVSDCRFVFSGGTTQTDLEMQCKLIVANILHPGYRPEAISMLHRKLPSVYRKLTTTPDGAYTIQSAKAMYGNDPRFNVPSEEQVKAITMDDVKAAMEPFLQKGAIEVTLVGDFDVEAALPILECTFGAMPARNAEFTKPSDEQRSVNFRPWGQREFFPYPTTLDKTLVTHVRPAGNGMDRRRNRRLTVLCAIAREKLFDGIRAQMGEAYSPFVRLSVNQELKNAATITAISPGVKGNREKVSAAMDSILTGLGKGDSITQEDFDCAIRPIISSAEKSLRQNSFWCNSLASLQSDPEQIILIRDLIKDLHSIKLEEIQELAVEVFGKDNANFYFTMPADSVPAGEAKAEHPAPEPSAEPEEKKPEEPATEPAATGKGAEMGYTVLTTVPTSQKPEWQAVIAALVKKYPGAQVVAVEKLTEDAITAALRSAKAHYAAIVLQPEEVGRETVNALHRAARKVDDDMWGDCLWGIVTGYTAADALRIASDDNALVIKRALGTTNIGWHPFEYSYCITDWTNAPVLEQDGNKEPSYKEYGKDTPEGKDGLQGLFAERLSNAGAQMVVSSSHATQFNLEMPFSRGLIFPANNRFYQLSGPYMSHFFSPLSDALRGRADGLAAMAEKLKCPVIEPDGKTRVWIAAGNCLFGDAHNSNQSMAITALSGYTCNQVVGYTVPSWYGAGGWGTFGSFVDMADNTTLAEAWYLNNQFILNNTKKIDPRLLKIQFNSEQIDYAFHSAIINSGVNLSQNNAKDAVGLVHDRDVVAFYGDPAWSATVDTSLSPRPLATNWVNEKTVTISANRDYKGRLGIWFPTPATGKGATGCDAPDAIFTNDFILFPEIEMKKGETRTITIN
ncbi:MAG: insulinase family protein [Akkermansia sp.]|nr:insulinase family protein [Akkermansia sp.]